MSTCYQLVNGWYLCRRRLRGAPGKKSFGLSSSEIARQDLSDQSIQLLHDYGDLDASLNIVFDEDEPPRRPVRATQPEISRYGYRVIWLENPITQELVRVEVSSAAVEQKLNHRIETSAMPSLTEATAADGQSPFYVPWPQPLKTNSSSNQPTKVSHGEVANPEDDISRRMKLVYAFIQVCHCLFQSALC